MAPEYVGLEAGFEAEVVRLQSTVESVTRIFDQRFDFDRAEQLAKLSKG